MHQQTESGGFSDAPVEVVGPDSDGIILEIAKTDVAIEQDIEDAPYWGVYEETFPLQEKNSYVRVRSLRGRNFKRVYELQLEQIFGRQFKDQ